MASPFQQRARQRKLIYGGLVLVLWFLAFGWRKADFRALGVEVHGVDRQARDLAVREESRGQVDLLGALVRLGTMGSRGIATCVEWYNAQEAQKKNQWNELEVHALTLAKLQPHFITPWLYQSWNLSYNVSVEADRINDKYFYIARGIQFLGEGERRNHDNPDIRWHMGFFLQHKIGQSDQTNSLRSLLQLSMIPPNERDPGRFWVVRDGRQEVNLREFEEFCKDHPQLVRRLREGVHTTRRLEYNRQFRCDTADDVVRFLADNFRVPSLWVDALPSAAGAWKKKQDADKPLADRFPVLPPPFAERVRPNQQVYDDRTLTTDSTPTDEDDSHQISRAWYSFAQEPLPPPGDLPGQNGPVVDPVHQRVPKNMMTVIFRGYPAQAQRFTSERLEDEGWFDGSGWAIPDWFHEQDDRFADNRPAIVGRGRKWPRMAQDAWQETFQLWDRHGRANHLLFEGEAARQSTEDRARAFADKYKLNQGGPAPALREENLDAETREEYRAYQFLQWYHQSRRVTNFPYHHNRALVEARDDTIRARKTLAEADRLRLRNKDPRALKLYLDPNGLKAWRDKVLLANVDFRRDQIVQEDSFEAQLRFVYLYARLGGDPFKAQAVGMVLTPWQAPAGAGACPAGFAAWVAPLIEKDWDNPLLGGPFDGTDDRGVPLVDEDARRAVLGRLFPATMGPPPAGGRPGPVPPPTATPSRPE